MGCGTVEAGDERARKEEAMQDVMKYVMREEDDVECSACEVWTTCGRVGVDGLTREEVSRMDVYCMKCVYRMMSEMRNRISAYEQRVDELEDTIKTLSTLVEGSQNTSDNAPTERESEGRKAPRRRIRRRNGRRVERPEETNVTRNYSAMLQANTPGSNTGSDEESINPESTMSQQESVESGSEGSVHMEGEED